IDMRVGNAELREEIARHARIVMLPGMDKPIAQGPAFGQTPVQRTNDWRYLHEIGPRPGDNVDQHGQSARLAAISIVARLTSNISAAGIGAGPPVRTASTKALAQAPCPLSWRQRFIRENPFQPQPR